MTTLTLGANEFDLAMPLALLLAAVVAMTSVRLLLRQWRAIPGQRSRTWRVVLLVLLQPLCATLLYLMLLPPTRPGDAGTLVVASAGATPAQLTHAKGNAVVALPEAPALPGVERVPDLATALRMRPGTARVRVVGTGLEARDREGLQGVAVAFEPALLPRGLVELDMSSTAVAGGALRLDGRVHGVPDGFAELRDPGRRRVDRVALSADGRFTLTATTRVPGAAVFGLRILDARQRVVETVALPVQIEAEPAPRVLVLAGAPGPELKFLRRWMQDAGLAMHTQIGVGGGVQLGDAPIALNAGSLARFDLLILDERAWSGLGDAQRAAVTDATNAGLGVLLRVTAALSDIERRRLRALGFAVDAGRDAHVVRLAQPTRDEDALRARLGPGTRDAPVLSDAAVADAPSLNRRALRITTADGLTLVSAANGAPLALFRAQGRGRIAVWTLTDSYRLVLAGRSDLHGALWSDAVAVLARAHPRRAFEIEGERRQGERIALCGVGKEARVTAPQGAQTVLHVDPATGARACGAFWPREAGWHRLESGDRTQRFHVRARADAAGLHANAVREATLHLATQPTEVGTRTAMQAPMRRRGARWPWWLAWLGAGALLWWLERSPLGRTVER